MRYLTASLVTAALAAGAAAQFGKEGATCGGIAALKCAAGFKCEQNPNDRACNPGNGGADCAGVCKKDDGSGQGGGQGGGSSAPSNYTISTAPGPVVITSKPYPTGGNSTTTSQGATTTTPTSPGAPLTSTSIVVSTSNPTGSASASAGASQGVAPGLVVDSLAWAAVGLGVFVGL